LQAVVDGKTQAGVRDRHHRNASQSQPRCFGVERAEAGEKVCGGFDQVRGAAELEINAGAGEWRPERQ
jgi:hypothetical protein